MIELSDAQRKQYERRNLLSQLFVVLLVGLA
jgi:hypothetical protein